LIDIGVISSEFFSIFMRKLYIFDRIFIVENYFLKLVWIWGAAVLSASIPFE